VVSKGIVAGGAKTAQLIRSQNGHLHDEVPRNRHGKRERFPRDPRTGDHIKNLPVGQMEILMVDPVKAHATRIFTCASIRFISWKDSSRLYTQRCAAISIQRLAPTCVFRKRKNVVPEGAHCHPG